MAARISADYKGKTVHMVSILKGSVFFTCELAKRITVPVTMDFMSVSSYGDDTKSSGVVRIVKDLDGPLQGKDVLLVEDEPEGFADAVAGLYQDTDACRELCRRTQEYIRGHFSVDAAWRVIAEDFA